MRDNGLREPISSEQPSGPDLDDTLDEDYADYMMLSGTRLPERYFSRDPGGSDREVPFDRSSVALADEIESIHALLRRSRDIRLLVTEARFQALSGSFTGFAETLTDLAELIELFWDSVHPTAQDGDFTGRADALEELNHPVHVVLALSFAPIAASGGAAVAYRQYGLAVGKTGPRPGEIVPTLDEVLGTLSSDRYVEQVTATISAVRVALDALAHIRATFIANNSNNIPNFDRLSASLTSIRDLIAEVRPDLSDGAPVPGTGDTEGGRGDTAAERPTVGSVQIASHAEAAAALLAAEQFFQLREPSAPALILVHQARMLFGRPLVEALEQLLPDNASSAALRFDSGMRFSIGLGQMRTVTDDVAANAVYQEESEEAATTFLAETRNDAASLLLGVEAFYRQVEPSSPIPMLLAKARSYLNKDFAAILAEILPRDNY